MARGTIGKRGKAKTWHIRFYDLTGKQRWESGFRTKKDAEAALAKRLTQTNIGEHLPKGNKKVAELADRWLELKKPDVRPKVFSSYRSHIERFKEKFGKLNAKNVTSEALKDYVASLKAKLAPATVNRQITVIKAIFNEAIEDGYLGMNPGRSLKRQKPPTKEIEVLTDEEMQKLIDNTDKHFKTLVLTGCYAGMRLSEILGLQWGDIDFNSGRIFVRRVLQLGQFYEPKTEKSKRAVIIPPSLVEALKIHQTGQAYYLIKNEHNLVFTTLDGEPINGVWFSQHVFTPALKLAGIRKLNFHALRHSYVSGLLDQGESIKYISEQVGHASAKMTLDVYSHLLPKAPSRAMQRLEKRIQKVVCK